MGAIWNFVRDYFDVVGAAAAFLASIQHSQGQTRSRVQLVIAWAIIAVAPLAFASMFLAPQTITRRQMSVTLVIYAAALYALICDGLRFGWAARLTKMRGEKWIKELDYVYLSLGALGILGSINRLDLAASGHYTRLDFLGPIILATALVVRLVKTRADIGGWNKL
ncbi:hypothetical protein [Bradyrhizobium retamae]|uniref:Uncharacterized protein n=1 Tax=Bradyrhizobium retamae TaxID=1300035 RepID=A0A0R3MUY0_9BRAD|nr:hypothetical protein [Bradyrhizobium retamae]KRR23928.1 hypothetical protein CQ13_26455 [Bradyrhizobium retamae]